MKNNLIIISIITIILVLAITFMYIKNNKYYTGTDFNIVTIKSEIDFDNDNIDDYTDILLGAKEEAKRRPKYKSAYYAGGYPPDNEGVCTDVIWRALKEAGYNLKDMVDKDIKNNLSLYPRVNNKPDTNIDFRRVPNLIVFFSRNTEVLTNDPYDIDEWMPGDIVTFSNNHIAIISNKRNDKGISYIIHNAGQLNFEEDALIKWHKRKEISGHFRFKLI